MESKSNFDVKVSTTKNQRFEVRTNTATNIPVNTQDNSVIIPIKTSKDTRMTIYAGSSNYLRYVIDNETGNYLQLEDNVLKLFSKTSKLLSAVSIPQELPEHATVRNKFLYVDSLGNLSWVNGGGEGSEYYSGAAISISSDRKINLLYDTRTLYVNRDGQVTVDLTKVQEKLVAGNENVIIEGNKIYTKKYNIYCL